MKLNKEENKILDKVIVNRKTIRNFISNDLPKEYIENIIKAGFLAPYGGATGIPLKESRKFFVMKNGTESHKKAKELIYLKIRKNYNKLEIVSKFLPGLRKKSKIFLERLKIFSKNGIPGLETAPYYIIIAEKKGMPPVEKQSMAHALENMWLKATAYGFGFQLLSATGMMSKNKEFMNLLGLNVGDYEIDGCLIGLPKQNISKNIKFNSENIKWLK